MYIINVYIINMITLYIYYIINKYKCMYIYIRNIYIYYKHIFIIYKFLCVLRCNGSRW